MGVTNFDSIACSGPVYSQGCPVVPFTTGTVRFVGSTATNASNNNAGTDVAFPLATVNGGMAKCTANVGDILVLLPGHAEAVTATSHTHSVAGVRVIGLGEGDDRPTFTFGAAAATITVSAASGLWRNCRFIANFADVAAAFTVGAAKKFVVDGCEFYDNAANTNFLSCVVTGSTNNAADGLTFTNNYVYSLPATDGAVVSVLGNLLRLNVSYNVVDKPGKTSDTAILLTMSSKVCGGVRIMNNVVTAVALTSVTVGALFTGSATTSSGTCSGNLVTTTDTTSAIIATTGTKISFSQNFMGGAVDASGVVWPAADTPS